jgi:hypothetical protein
MAKKRMSAEERKEFKGGKYMGGPAEEKAEKKKKGGKRMAFGGPVGYGGNQTNDPVGRGGMGGTGNGGVSGGMNAGGGGRGGPAGGVTTGTMTGTSARNMRGTNMEPEYKTAGPRAPITAPNKPKKSIPLPPVAPPQEMEAPIPRGGLMYGDGSMWPGQATPPRLQRGYSVRGGSDVTGMAGGPARAGSGSPINGPGGKTERELGYGASTGDREMRGGGLARKGKGLTMAKGGLVKGCGCVAKGVKKPRYT